MSSRRTYFALLIAASAVLLVPFFVIEILPLQDYPNHLARIHTLNHLENSPILREYYQASWALVPNLAMDVIVPLLARLFPLEVAGAFHTEIVSSAKKPLEDTLNEIDTEDVEELYNVNDMNNSLREDSFDTSLDKKDVLKNSPNSNSDYIEVPLTVKKESQ